MIKKFESFFDDFESGNSDTADVKLLYDYVKMLDDDMQMRLEGDYIMFPELSTGDEMKLTVVDDVMKLTLSGNIFNYSYEASYDSSTFTPEEVKNMQEEADEFVERGMMWGHMAVLFRESGMQTMIVDVYKECLEEDRSIVENRNSWIAEYKESFD